MGNLKIAEKAIFSTFISTFIEADKLFPYLSYGYN